MFCDAGAQRSARTRHEEDGGEGRLAVLLDALHGGQEPLRHVVFHGHEIFIELEIGRVLAVGGDHQQGQAGLRGLGIEGADDFERVGQVRFASARAGFCDLEIAARRGAATVDLDAGRLPTDHLAHLMFRHDAGDVIVDHDDIVHQTFPLGREHADGG